MGRSRHNPPCALWWGRIGCWTLHVSCRQEVPVDKLAEGPGPRRVGVAADGLREQACPDRPLIEAGAVGRCDLEQGRRADDDGQQPRAGDGHQQPPRVEDEPLFAARKLRVRDGRRDGDDIASPPWYSSTVFAVGPSGSTLSNAPRWALCGVTTPRLADVE